MQHTANLWPSHVIPLDMTPPGLYNSVDRNVGPTQSTPVSTAMYGTTSTFSWAHTVPSLMPWMPKGEPEVPENIVQFTAPFPPDPCTSQTATSWELLNNYGAKQTNANLHLKRKNEIDLVEAAPQKLCITEERMAARFKEMHISNQFSLPTEAAPFDSHPDCHLDMVSKPITNIKDLDFILNANRSDAETLSSKSLVLAPEIKKLVEPEKLFANTFLNKVERPTMALVLWEPQSNPIFRTNENSAEKKSQEEENSNVFIPPQTTPLWQAQLLRRNKNAGQRKIQDKENLNNFLPQHNTSLCNPGLLPDICSTADKSQQTTFDEEMDD